MTLSLVCLVITNAQVILSLLVSSEGALIAITPYDYPQRSAHFLSTHRPSTTT